MLVVDGNTLTLSFVMSSADEYSFSLEDPEGLLWEGSLSSSGGFYTSGELAIGAGATFMDGEYSYRVMNSRGQVESGTVSYSGEKLEGSVDAILLDHNATRSEDGTASFRDRYANRITISSGQP